MSRIPESRKIPELKRKSNQDRKNNSVAFDRFDAYDAPIDVVMEKSSA
jgi:hypothetical protein